jgi:zinc protease
MRRTARLGVALAICIGAGTLSAPAAFAQGSPQAPLSVPYTLFTLQNGLTVILHEDHTLPVVSVNVWYHAGSGREKPGRTGFAHLFEHLMFEGSKHVKEGAFDSLLEAAGGDNNGSTNNDRTNYGSTCPRTPSSSPSSSSRTGWATCSTSCRRNWWTASATS